MKKYFLPLLISFPLIIAFNTVQAQDEPNQLSWPLEIESEKGLLTTLYQPQLESFKENDLEGRMAVTMKPKDKDLIFGAVWFNATVSTNKENRTVVLEKIEILKTYFPDIVSTEQSEKFGTYLEEEIQSWNLVMSLDVLQASLSEVENLSQLSDQINNNPPKIYFRTTPSALVMIDGEPKFKADQTAGLEYVVNTAFFIVKDTKSSMYYINGGNFWYSSKSISEGWSTTTSVPENIKSFAEKNAQKNQEEEKTADTPTTAPDIIISTVPAELILVDGEIDYKPIDQTSLLYVANSENDIIMNITSQEHFILIAGRWYYSTSLKDGDWEFTDPEALPADFSKIPDNSEMADVRGSIPGTPEAQDALLEQSIPQTATIDRKEAKFEATYDGDPKFSKIEGTDVSYAVNTDKSVLLIKNKYYGVEEAVWFVSSSPKGPWEVSTERPSEVDQIPPEAPVYNVKYVYIYESTPEVVYVGYLPGYTYSYVYGGVVVYGTGYTYPYWYRSYYYPRPVTYGYGVHYNPYTGWGFTVGMSYGWVSWGYHPYGGGYWGPRGYNTGYRHGYNAGYYNGARNGYRAGYAAGSRNNGNQNMYTKRGNGVKNTPQRGNVNTINSKAKPSTKPNNMYTDKAGNVYQQNKNGGFDNKSNKPNASQRPANSQKPATQDRPNNQQRPATQPAKQPSTQPAKQPQQSRQTTQPAKQPQQARPTNNQSQQQRSSQQQLENSARARNQGAQNYNRSQQNYSGASRPSGGASRPAGGGTPRGGGRR